MTTAEPYQVEHVDTARLPAADRSAYWAEHVCRNHGTLRFAFGDPDAFHGRTIVQRAADRQLVDFWSDGIGYTRTVDDVRSDADESLRLLVPITGMLRLRQDDVATEVAPGSAAVVTKTRPFDVAHDGRTRAWIMNLPAGAVPTAGGPLCMGVRRGTGAIIASLISELSEQRCDVDGATFRSVTDTITDLIALLGRPHGALPDTLTSVDSAVRDYVRRNAHDPALTPAIIAHELGWSLRQIQLALRRTGTTPSKLLRDARLDLARRWLGEPASERTIASIAHASGFRSLSVFGTAFKARYGVTPRQAREAGRC
ncbi:AraC-type DNA-binding protein [Haloechinothrix alba]|uniref:AraC-type DNA-binding protein n=1 Tax=Haloechinothrix alba TaxID=664784 RepID=A0A238VFV1_9PSEU|nr:AraC family transcriptional regulator [Haloechinothrix alba]SNR32957.1 AraC-type DNA-binding protein [Haloechinothrix alba]